jgi:hypothetical protein
VGDPEVAALVSKAMAARAQILAAADDGAGRG